MKIEIDVDIPVGYEATGEYRQPNKGEIVLVFGCQAAVCEIDGVQQRIILRKRNFNNEEIK